jgi:hypothetical protein
MNYLDLEFRGFQYDMMTKFLDLENDKIKNILGHRGCGLTTASCIYALWVSMFYPGSSIAFYTPGTLMVRDIKNIFNLLYQKVLQKWDTNQKLYYVSSSNQRYIRFENKSKVLFCSTIVELRGNKFDITFYDNPYLGPKNAEVFEQTAPASNKCVILNTFLPPDEHELEKVGTLTTYPWYCNPNLTQNWYLTMLNSLGNADFLLKYGCTRGT